MISPWSCVETPIIEDGLTLFKVHPRGSSKSVRELYGEFMQYIRIMDDTLSQPITDTFLWQGIAKGVEYIGELR